MTAPFDQSRLIMEMPHPPIGCDPFLTRCVARQPRQRKHSPDLPTPGIIHIPLLPGTSPSLARYSNAPVDHHLSCSLESLFRGSWDFRVFLPRALLLLWGSHLGWRLPEIVLSFRAFEPEEDNVSDSPLASWGKFHLTVSDLLPRFVVSKSVPCSLSGGILNINSGTPI